jgi:hypothetical protein
MSIPAQPKTTRQKRPPHKDDPSSAPLMSSDPAQQVAVTTITAARHRPDELDAEAAYYHRRAIQEQQALGPGYYVDLLQTMATDRAAMAQQIRTGKGQPNQPINTAKHAIPPPPAINPPAESR